MIAPPPPLVTPMVKQCYTSIDNIGIDRLFLLFRLSTTVLCSDYVQSVILVFELRSTLISILILTVFVVRITFSGDIIDTDCFVVRIKFSSVILVLTVFVVRFKYNNAMFGLRSKCYIGTDCFCCSD